MKDITSYRFPHDLIKSKNVGNKILAFAYVTSNVSQNGRVLYSHRSLDWFLKLDKSIRPSKVAEIYMDFDEALEQLVDFGYLKQFTRPSDNNQIVEIYVNEERFYYIKQFVYIQEFEIQDIIASRKYTASVSVGKLLYVYVFIKSRIWVNYAGETRPEIFRTTYNYLSQATGITLYSIKKIIEELSMIGMIYYRKEFPHYENDVWHGGSHVFAICTMVRFKDCVFKIDKKYNAAQTVYRALKHKNDESLISTWELNSVKGDQ